jgi:hypothetical protein
MIDPGPGILTYLYTAAKNEMIDMAPGVKLGEEMRPVPQLKSLFYTYILSAAAIFFVAFCLPLMLFAPGEVAAILAVFPGIPVLIGFLAALIWVGKYYDSMHYKLTDHEMIWHRGVWFRNTGIVPYNRITNVDIEQGPVSRRYGIATIKVQTAGYSAAGARKAEITIEGMKNFEEIRDAIMELVKGQKPVAVETYGKSDVRGEINSQAMGELVKIRKLLERTRRK